MEGPGAKSCNAVIRNFILYLLLLVKQAQPGSGADVVQIGNGHTGNQISETAIDTEQFASIRYCWQ